VEAIGDNKVLIYPSSDEYPHTPGQEENWQESFVLHFMDAGNRAGAYLRIGHEPNMNGGEIILFSNVVSPDGIFHRTDTVSIKAGDVTDTGISCSDGALSYSYDGKNIIWRIEEPGISAELVLENFHPAIDCYPKVGEVSDIAKHHVEVAVRVTGTITTQGNSYVVDGLGMRDHSWGSRNWSALISHRWTFGIFDKENSFCALTMHTSDDNMAKFGWVVRGDKVIYAEEVDIVTYLEADGVSNRGGITRMKLVTGEVFEARFEAITPCVTSWVRGILGIDNFCKVHWGDRVGVGDFELTNNIMRGSHRPGKYDAGTINENGWHKGV
jgi:pterin-4a-carbinolamine dehydratase